MRGDDGQGALDARMQRPLEPLVDSAAQRDQAALEGATRLDPPDLQGLAGGTDGALQRVVLLDLSLEHRLHFNRGLSCPRNLLLQLCDQIGGMGLRTKEKQIKQGAQFNRTHPLTFSSRIRPRPGRPRPP